MDFPYSNCGYLQLHYGENMECLLESMVAIFEHIGGVPTEIWFDNTRTIVTKIIRGGGREVTERFLRFQEHYGFKSVFCNPDAGNEKGGVLYAYFFYLHILTKRLIYLPVRLKDADKKYL